MAAMSDQDFVQDYLGQSASALAAYRSDPGQLDLLMTVAAAVAASMLAGGKLLIAGNGGSAADALHIAGEFTGRMLYDRAPLPAVALCADQAAFTAIGNDYGFEHVYDRQVLALGRAGDVLLALSTSGNSPNVVRAMRSARSIGVVTVGFTGAGGGVMAGLADHLLRAPSSFTPVVQQIHMVAAHIVCSLVERAMFPRPV